VVIAGSIAATDVAALCERARPLLAALASADAGPLICVVERLSNDAAAVDLVAHIALSARRVGRGIRLRDASPTLVEVLAFAGLAETIPCELDSGLDPGR
jgi:hypothetical protein